jgi:hypothetical protein
MIMMPYDMPGRYRRSQCMQTFSTPQAASAHENTAGIALLDKVAAQATTVSRALVDQGFKSSVVAHGATVGIEPRSTPGTCQVPER